MENCIFCKIVKGDIPCHLVWEDEKHLAFLSIHPIKDGHTLVIPKKHHPYTFEIPDLEYTELWIAVKKISTLLKNSFHPKSGKVGSIVYGMDVDHSHIHLVPIDKSGDLSFTNAKPATPEKLKEIQEKITLKS